MINIKKILYPTDFSKLSLAAFPYAIDLMQRYGAQLHCIHVLDIDNEFFAEEGFIAPLAVKMPLPQEELKKTAQEHLNEIVRKHLASTQGSVVKKVILGKPFAEIISYARQENIDLIVIGTHGHSALASMLMGSVAEKVVHKAPCPVLTIRHPEHKFVSP